VGLIGGRIPFNIGARLAGTAKARASQRAAQASLDEDRDAVRRNITCTMESTSDVSRQRPLYRSESYRA